MNMFPRIFTLRCILDSITGGEYSILEEIFEDPQTKRFLPEIYELIDKPDGVQTFISVFDHYHDNDQGILWGIYNNEALLGFVAVMDLPENPTLFYAMHSKARSRGYMKESVSYIIDYLRKNQLYAKQIYSDVYKDNYASMNILKDLGFVIHTEDDKKIYMSLSLA